MGSTMRYHIVTLPLPFGNNRSERLLKKNLGYWRMLFFRNRNHFDDVGDVVGLFLFLGTFTIGTNTLDKGNDISSSSDRNASYRERGSCIQVIKRLSNEELEIRGFGFNGV